MPPLLWAWQNGPRQVWELLEEKKIRLHGTVLVDLSRCIRNSCPWCFPLSAWYPAALSSPSTGGITQVVRSWKLLPLFPLLCQWEGLCEVVVDPTEGLEKQCSIFCLPTAAKAWAWPWSVLPNHSSSCPKKHRTDFSFRWENLSCTCVPKKFWASLTASDSAFL